MHQTMLPWSCREPRSSGRRWSASLKTALAVLLASALAACASSNPDYRNVPLADGASNKPVASPVEADPNAPIIMIAFSGGGSRAAALGLGVLDQLKAVTYPAGGVQRPLVDQVKIVSSVSGGSVVAGWFGLVGPARMDEMKDKFLALDNTSALVGRAADPITWVRLTFSDFTRIDALSNLFDRELFQNAKFA